MTASADSVDSAKQALSYGAEGIGMFYTENLFLKPERLSLLQQSLLSEDEVERSACLKGLQSMQQEDLGGIFQLLGKRSITVALLNSPVQDLLPIPGSAEFANEVEKLALLTNQKKEECLRKLLALREINPMLGCRGVRMAIMRPEIANMQIRAIITAAIEAKKHHGFKGNVQILLPFLFSDHEVAAVTPSIECIYQQLCTELELTPNQDFTIDVCASIDVPRACLRADRITAEAMISAVSIDLDALTELAFGLSKVDEVKFMVILKLHYILVV